MAFVELADLSVTVSTVPLETTATIGVPGTNGCKVSATATAFDRACSSCTEESSVQETKERTGNNQTESMPEIHLHALTRFTF